MRIAPLFSRSLSLYPKKLYFIQQMQEVFLYVASGGQGAILEILEGRSQEHKGLDHTKPQ
jgi:hypothetical protein